MQQGCYRSLNPLQTAPSDSRNDPLTEPSVGAIELTLANYPEIELNSLKLSPILRQNCEAKGNLHAINMAR
jgi:hypothetical protein